MKLGLVSALALVFVGGCMRIRAQVPEDVVRGYARRDGVELPALCTRGGETFSEGAVVCMDEHRMVCDAAGRWVVDGGC